MTRRGVVAVLRNEGVVAVAEVTPHPDLSSTDPEDLYLSLSGDGSTAPPERTVLEAWLAADHDARRRRVPVAARLVSDPADRVAVNGLLGQTGGVAEATALAGDYRTMKIKVGPDPEQAVARVSEIRRAIDREVALRVDVGGAWTAAIAVSTLEALAGLDIEYVEDPLPSTADWRPLRGSPVPLAVDVATPADELLEVVDVVILKPAMATPAASLEAAARARDHGVDVVVTSIIDGAIGVSAALNMAAALGVKRACGLATSSLLERNVADPPPIRNGSMELDRPGIGVVLDDDRLRQVTVSAFANSSKG